MSISASATGSPPGSDRWVAKTILSYEFPVPGKKDEDRDR